MSTFSRRSFLVASPFAVLPLLAAAPTVPVADRAPTPAPAPPTPAPPTPAPPPAVSAGFPTQEPDLVSEMVGASHGNVARVKELVGRHPTLAKAAWDWGFGDWESALGAASHVGNREIAEILLASGARPSIFSAAMLGQLDVVKAFVAAAPGIQKTKGPHGITLLSHARAGGAPAQPVAEFLTALGGADEKLTAQVLSAENLATITGTYVFGKQATERIEVRMDKERLMFERAGRSPRVLIHLGSLECSPVGAESVRIRFQALDSGVVLTVHDPEVVLTARKAS